MHDNRYAKLGEKHKEGQIPDVWWVDIDQFKSLNPKQYFVTSGEAVEKAVKLEKDAWNLAGQLRRFRMTLQKAKGTAKYLECGWGEDGLLLAKKKNPRIQKDNKERKRAERPKYFHRKGAARTH